MRLENIEKAQELKKRLEDVRKLHRHATADRTVQMGCLLRITTRGMYDTCVNPTTHAEQADVDWAFVETLLADQEAALMDKLRKLGVQL